MTQDEVVEAVKRAMREKIEQLGIDIDLVENERAIVTEQLDGLKTEKMNLEFGLDRLRSGGVPESTPEQQPNRPPCKRCGSEKTHRDGLIKKDGKPTRQVWRCKECGAKFRLPLETFQISTEPDTRNVPTRKQPKGSRKGLRKDGVTRRTMIPIKAQVDEGTSIYYKDIVENTELSTGSIWTAMNNIVEENPNKYEWFKDVSQKYNPKGIRLKDAKLRKNVKKTVIFCPECKTLLIPGQNCVKCK